MEILKTIPFDKYDIQSIIIEHRSKSNKLSELSKQDEIIDNSFLKW